MFGDGVIESQETAWPEKTRELENHHLDSTIWNDFKFRDDDIVIASYAKSGTTWLQQIVSQLIFKGREDLPVAQISPWVDLRVPSKEVKLPELEKQKHRRFMKTHLPVDALVYSPKAKYIYVGRDGRDVAWSLHNHHVNANQLWYDLLNDTPGRVGPPVDRPSSSVKQYYYEWMESDGYPFWPFWENVRSWWSVRELPNLLLLHFSDLKADLPGVISRISNFLEIPIQEENRAAIITHCTFKYMKAHAESTVPMGGTLWDGGAQTFLHKGINGRWREMLSAADNIAYRQRASEELGEECAEWLLGRQEEPR